MKKQIIVVSLFLVLNFVFCKNVFAAPDIDSVNGTFVNSAIVIVTGIDFGVKYPVAPMLWSDFENGVAGAALPTVSPWVAYKGNGGLFNSKQHYSGNLAAYQTYNYTSPDGESTSNYFFPVEIDETYVSYVTKYHKAGNTIYGQWKNTRIVGTGQAYNGPGMGGFSDNAPLYDPGPSPIGTMSSPDVRGFTYYQPIDNPLGIRDENWHRIDMYKKLSTPGITDGQIWENIDNDDSNVDYSNSYNHKNLNAITRLAGETFKHAGIILGLMHTNTLDGDIHEIWLDDLYVDNTQARLEICSGSVWASRSHCEVQIPQNNWSNEQIEFKVNQGTFLDNSTAYLYVIDAAGDFNVYGYSIIFGSSAVDLVAPSAPSGLSVM